MKYAIALGLSLLINLVATKLLIPYLHKLKFGQTVREDGPQTHLVKTGIPTMGGIGFVCTTVLVCLLLVPSAFATTSFQVVLLAYVGYAAIGFVDDYLIVVRKNNEGLKPKLKLGAQCVLAIVLYLMYASFGTSEIMIPFFHTAVDFGWFFPIVVFIMFTGETNAVNFTDGVDGLSSGLVIIATIPFVYFALKEGQNDLAVILCSLIGSLLGYLYYNKYPCKIMMGDTGSLAMGGILSAAALLLHQEIALIIIGGMFLAEMFSVILQVSYFKLTHGKRIFKMAPLHHHFELSGYKETQVVAMFYAVGAVFAVIGILMGVMM